MQLFSKLDSRTLLAYKNIAASFFLRAFTGIISLILVPLTLKCLGEYENGVWLTISSILLWIENFDVGLGNGLRNKLSAYVAHEDWQHARKAVSTTFILMFAIMIPAAAILVGAIYALDLYSMLNISPDAVPNLKEVMSIGVVLFSSTFIMKTIGNVFLGMQLPAVSNFLVTAGHPIILLGTWLMYTNGIHSLLYITILNLGTPLLVYFLAYPYTFYVKYPRIRPSYKLFDKTMISELMSLGIMFFINQIASSIILLSANILISRWFSPAMVTPYQIAYRYFSMVILVFTLVCSPIWSATTDAYERGDIAWIKKTFRKITLFILLIGLGLLIMVVVSEPVYLSWIGTDTTVPLSITISMAIYIMCLVSSLAFCFILNGLGKLRLQLYCTLLGTVLFFIAAPVLTRLIGNASSLAIATSIALLPNMICNPIQSFKVINGTAKGLWQK